MGIFHTAVGVENPLQRGVVEQLPRVLVDTGSELSWVPAPVLERLGIAREKREQRFRMADGGVLTRSIGYGILHAGGTQTIDEIVFSEPEDLMLLGARTLEGLNLRVDVQAKQLVAGGSIVVAAVA